MPTEDYTERILQLRREYTDYRPQQVTRQPQTLGIREGRTKYGEFTDAVKALMKSSRLVLSSSKTLTLLSSAGRSSADFASTRGFSS
ncbi:MAG: hypothetical protein H6816_08680 [Phycisphaerales bacterium]|nr:hypothetical protein [Phycisphaerales bacterium]